MVSKEAWKQLTCVADTLDDVEASCNAGQQTAKQVITQDIKFP